VRYIVQ